MAEGGSSTIIQQVSVPVSLRHFHYRLITLPGVADEQHDVRSPSALSGLGFTPFSSCLVRIQMEHWTAVTARPKDGWISCVCVCVSERD